MAKSSRDVKELARATVEVASESGAVAALVANLKRFARERNVDAKMDPIALGAVAALMKRGLLPSFDTFLEHTVAAAREIADHHEARVTGAVPLTADERAALLKALEARLGGSVALEERTNPSLIGGLLVETDGWRFDASVKGKIARLQKTLSTSY